MLRTAAARCFARPAVPLPWARSGRAWAAAGTVVAAAAIGAAAGTSATLAQPTMKDTLASMLDRLETIVGALNKSAIVVRTGKVEDAAAILGMIEELAILENVPTQAPLAVPQRRSLPHPLDFLDSSDRLRLTTGARPAHHDPTQARERRLADSSAGGRGLPAAVRHFHR